MPVTKQYLTYKAECRYGVVAGRKGGALLTRRDGGRLVALSPALEGVLLWEPRTSNLVSAVPRGQDTPTLSPVLPVPQVGELNGGGGEVCVLCLSGDGQVLAAGLEDGSVVLWDMASTTMLTLRSGSKVKVHSAT